MAKLFIFGIGGTGARVLRSLTMILASGVDTNGYEIVPVLIDPDASNGDGRRNVELLNNYINIHNQLSFTEQSQNVFFKTPVVCALQNYTIPVQNTNNMTFRQFIGLNSMISIEDQAMAEMLFSKKNLDSSMEVGFKGNPNIGSVVLNQITGTPEFQKVANLFGQGDKIFIISSIFGGTGASGFPLLLKSLRNNKTIPNAGLINNAEIGAISVLPYFNLQSNPQSAIDSSTFFSKARAALKYYQNNVTDANALYYIGDIPSNQYENFEGGNQQENAAHLIEVLSATAIIDFCKKTHQIGQTEYLEIGLSNNDSSVTLQSFPSSNMRKIYAYNMIAMSLFAKSLVDDYDFVSSNKLKKNKDLKKDIYSEEFVQNVKKFLIEYKSWLKELKDNKPSFVPFNMEAGLKDLVTDVKGKSSFFSSLDENTFRSELNGVKAKSSSDEDKFMETYCIAATNFAHNKYQF